VYKRQEYDEYTFEHSVDVATYTTIIAKECGTPTEELSSICTGALLHDVGKMLVDQDISNKPGRLSDDEFEIIKTHSSKGYEILIENQVDEEIAILDQNEGIVRPVIQLLSDSDENELEDKAVINLMDNKEFYVIDCMETPPVR